MLKVNVTKRITSEEVQMIVDTTGMSKSAKIKELWDGGLGIKEISAAMNVIYNHSYNVIQNYVLVNGFEITKAARATGAKRQDIEKSILDGMTNMEVAKKYKVAYNRVWKIKDDMIKDCIVAAPEKAKRIVITPVEPGYEDENLPDEDIEVLEAEAI